MRHLSSSFCRVVRGFDSGACRLHGGFSSFEPALLSPWDALWPRRASCSEACLVARRQSCLAAFCPLFTHHTSSPSSNLLKISSWVLLLNPVLTFFAFLTAAPRAVPGQSRVPAAAAASPGPLFFIRFYFLFYFLLFTAIPRAYGDSQARGPIRATAARRRHSHSSTRSEPRLQPTPQARDRTRNLMVPSRIR